MKMNSGGTALEWVADNNTEYTADLPLSISGSNVISTAFTTNSADIMSNKTIYNPIITGASGANPKFTIKDESLTHTLNILTPEIGADINITFPSSTGILALEGAIPTTYWDLLSNNLYPKLDTYNVIIGDKTNTNQNNCKS